MNEQFYYNVWNNDAELVSENDVVLLEPIFQQKMSDTSKIAYIFGFNLRVVTLQYIVIFCANIKGVLSTRDLLNLSIAPCLYFYDQTTDVLHYKFPAHDS